MKLRNWQKLIGSIGVCLSAGFFGSFFTVSQITTWYATLNKPSFSPPNWIFGPVWTTLYVLMGISLYVVWQTNKKPAQLDKQKGVVLFAVQLVLNTAWSILFFGLESPTLAFVEIIVLWLAILFTLLTFYKVSKLSSYLLIPYLLWVSFATFLNGAIVLLN